MADTAFQEMFRQEVVMGFEKGQSLARRTTTVETEINGNEATFLVADSGGATATTRGVNGDIPTRPDNLNQFTVLLQEWHDVPERTRFNIYASQGDGRRIMQETSMKVINRKIDDDIYEELNTASTTWTGGAAAATVALVSDARTILANNFALDEEPWAIITPAFCGQLMGFQQFTSSDFVNLKGFENVSKSRAFNWYGVNWIVDAGLPGTGSSTADCFMHAKAAIGHACDIENIRTEVGYDRKNDKSWARATTFMGSKLLQDIGVVKMTHDDTASFPVNTT